MVPFSVIIKDIYLLTPIVCLMAMLLGGYSVFMAAMGAIVASFVISFFKKKTAMTPRRLLEALRSAGEKMVMIALACAGAGMVVAIVTHTGLALGIASVISHWSGGFLLPALLLIMITSLILGMGMPCTPAYIIAVTIGGPALVALGTDILPAHLLVFYYAILAEVTPPVCIPAYCAASIARSEPLKTGFEAFKLAIPAFCIPLIFTYNQALLLKGSVVEIASLALTLIIGVILLSAAVTGFFVKRLSMLMRAMLGAGAAGAFILCAHREMLAQPVILLAGAAIIVAFLFWRFSRRRRLAPVTSVN
jgi:TRAP-type uncharacterized transport system fused permease subunit